MSGDFQFTESEKILLLKIARESLRGHLQGQKLPDYNESTLPDQLLKQFGAFVSLYKNDELVGCIGRMMSELPLYKLIQKMTISAAVGDRRFPDVNLEELNNVRFELSILSPLHKITEIHEIEPGKHGI